MDMKIVRVESSRSKDFQTEKVSVEATLKEGESVIGATRLMQKLTGELCEERLSAVIVSKNEGNLLKQITPISVEELNKMYPQSGERELQHELSASETKPKELPDI